MRRNHTIFENAAADDIGAPLTRNKTTDSRCPLSWIFVTDEPSTVKAKQKIEKSEQM